MYKRIDVYLGMAAALLAFVLAVPVAKADFQCDQDQGDGHAPFDANNTDNELYVTMETMPNFQIGNTQTCEAAQLVRFSLEKLPIELQALFEMGRDECIRFGPAGGDPGPCEYYPVGANEACTLTDVNGDARQVGQFHSQFTRSGYRYEDPRYWDYIYVEALVYCSDY